MREKRTQTHTLNNLSLIEVLSLLLCVKRHSRRVIIRYIHSCETQTGIDQKPLQVHCSWLNFTSTRMKPANVRFSLSFFFPQIKFVPNKNVSPQKWVYRKYFAIAQWGIVGFTQQIWEFCFHVHFSCFSFSSLHSFLETIEPKFGKCPGIICVKWNEAECFNWEGGWRVNATKMKQVWAGMLYLMVGCSALWLPNRVVFLCAKSTKT